MDKEHLLQVLELDDKNVVGFYRQLLSPILGTKMKGLEPDLAANLTSYVCTFLMMRGRNLDLARSADVDAAVDFLVDFIFRGLGIERGFRNRKQ